MASSGERTSAHISREIGGRRRAQAEGGSILKRIIDAVEANGGIGVEVVEEKNTAISGTERLVAAFAARLRIFVYQRIALATNVSALATRPSGPHRFATCCLPANERQHAKCSRSSHRLATTAQIPMRKLTIPHMKRCSTRLMLLHRQIAETLR